MTFKPLLVAALLFTLASCTIPTAPPVYRLLPADDASTRRLDELARIASLSPEQRRRETAQLDEQRRLEPSQRFQLAALLEREDTVDAMERSLKLLTGLNDGNSRTEAVSEMMKRSLRARLDARQLAARNQELQNKLEQIKTLEKSLQQRAAPLDP